MLPIRASKWIKFILYVGSRLYFLLIHPTDTSAEVVSYCQMTKCTYVEYDKIRDGDINAQVARATPVALCSPGAPMVDRAASG